MFFGLFADTGAQERGPELGPSLTNVPEPHNLACPDTSGQACAAPLNLGASLNNSAAFHPGAFFLRILKYTR